MSPGVISSLRASPVVGDRAPQTTLRSRNGQAMSRSARTRYGTPHRKQHRRETVANNRRLLLGAAVLAGALAAAGCTSDSKGSNNTPSGGGDVLKNISKD